jgi:YfiH family protein
MVDERLRAIAAVHAGWRGTVQQIAARAVEALAARYSSRPEDLVVAIGPGICGKCYTVGAPVAVQFQAWFPERTDLDRVTTVDLTEANRRQLVAAGVPEGRICTGAPCTCCRSEEFYSHRRSGGKPGRMISAIGIAR